MSPYKIRTRQFGFTATRTHHKANRAPGPGWARSPGCLRAPCWRTAAWGSARAGSPEHRPGAPAEGAWSFRTLACPGSPLSATGLWSTPKQRNQNYRGDAVMTAFSDAPDILTSHPELVSSDKVFCRGRRVSEGSHVDLTRSMSKPSTASTTPPPTPSCRKCPCPPHLPSPF